MSVKNVFQAVSAEALDCIFVKAHDVSEEQLPGILCSAEISLRISCIFIEKVCLTVSGHIHSGHMITCLVEMRDHLGVAFDILSHSVTDLDYTLDLGCGRRIEESHYLISVAYRTYKFFSFRGKLRHTVPPLPSSSASYK